MSGELLELPAVGPAPPDTARVLAELAGLARRHHLAEVEQRCLVAGLQSRLGEFDVAVFGQFKAGKSSLLNSLLGLPRLSAQAGGPVRVRDMVDLALAVGSERPPVANDLTLASGEQVVFITGPNQGGKTTFARSFGQLAYLAGLGLPVPASSASLPWCRPVLTHFPAPDDPDHDRGGLADELHRLHSVLAAAGPHALLVFNELFSATSAADALQLSARVVAQLRGSGCRVLWVTFLEELVLGTPGAVSLVGQVEPDDVTRPTFRFRAQPPGGRSHAVALAARHGLSSDDLAERLR